MGRARFAGNVVRNEESLMRVSHGLGIGLLGTAFMVVYMIGAPVFGRLAERTSRWILVGVGVILWSLASGASGLAGTFGALLMTRCAVGIGEAAYGPIAPAVISDLYPVEKRGQVLAWFYVAIPVGSALGYVLGGVLGWPWSFYWVVPPGLATMSLSAPGCSRVSSTILADPSTVCAARMLATSRGSPMRTPPSLSASIIT